MLITFTFIILYETELYIRFFPILFLLFSFICVFLQSSYFTIQSYFYDTELFFKTLFKGKNFAVE